tara:strand:- start:235 stop:804 length:570 start_codon:yes stop_codon:yes gene_type:complete
MLYATLEEAYNISSFKKPKKKKLNKNLEPIESMEPIESIESMEHNNNIHPYDKFDSTMVSNDLSRTTTHNQCDPLQAPPYIFPIEEKAKKHYEEALNDMNSIDTKIESNIDDELDAYLNDEEYTEINNTTIVPYTKKTTKPIKPIKTDKIDKPTKTDKLFDRIYELFILILLAILIILMCEVIVRIAKN